MHVLADCAMDYVLYHVGEESYMAWLGRGHHAYESSLRDTASKTKGTRHIIIF